MQAGLVALTDELHRFRSGLAETRLSSIEECYSESDSAFAADEPDAESLLLQQEDRA